jgi:hypothetical protein
LLQFGGFGEEDRRFKTDLETDVGSRTGLELEIGPANFEFELENLVIKVEPVASKGPYAAGNGVVVVQVNDIE